MKLLEQRLADAVRRKLGAPVTLARWVKDQRTGADIPVFDVPVSHQARARELGLTVA